MLKHEEQKLRETINSLLPIKELAVYLKRTAGNGSRVWCPDRALTRLLNEAAIAAENTCILLNAF